MSLIENLDNLGKEFRFNIKGKYSYKTVTGGVLSIILNLTSVVLVFYFGQDMWFKEKPKTYTKSSIRDKTPIVDLSGLNFNIPFRLESFDGTLIDNPIYFDYLLVGDFQVFH